MTEQTIEITFDDIKELMDKKYYLVYIDYRSNFNGSESELQDAIRKQDWSPLDENLEEWLWESQADSVDYILKSLRDEIASHFEIDQSDAEDLIDQYEEELKDEIYNRDFSTPIEDMLRNTSDSVCFYDTGYYIENETWNLSNKELKEELHNVKKALKIVQKNKTYDNELDLMIRQASYGGNLVVYFNGDIEEMMKIGKNNTIHFKNPAVAIIDTYNGSGDSIDCLNKHEFSLPLDLENIFFDKTIKYNYTFSVCGMSANWCNSTDVSFLKKRIRAVNKKSNLQTGLDVDKMYQDAYNKGECTFGDMDMRRHRDTYYKNDYPCGTHCPHCSTFWID